ncbi:hypothetical protein OEZ85_010334 [Tetradesmus obliquus]|uniref:Uncharacterized protein n=1 Tax=Tetradesmus obliquus TaxID=3088 RepID=A0ABY8TP35_TETOB|nr:hypothetical protein OEZ85_010334 [Tetradesmus obliquus]
MKIQIEVNLEPHEFDLANELLRTLNQLTEHVRVRRGSSQGSAPTPTAAAAAAAAAAPPAAAGPPAAVPVVPMAMPLPAAAAPPPAPATPQDARRMFSEQLRRLGDAAQLDAVSAELGRLFGSSPLPPQALQEEFLEAFFGVAFDPGLLQPPGADLGVAPYMHVLPRLPEGVRDNIKSKVIAKVLGHLNQKRAAGASRREEFYLQADAFAVLSEMDFVGIDGAIQTIEKLLKNGEKRAAAITTLGKTVERCRAKLGSANPAFLASLFRVLDGVAEPAFQYDIEWINNNMQRSRPQQPGVTVPAAAPTAAPPAAAGAAPPAAAAAAPAGPNRSSLRLGVTGTFSSPSLGAEPGGTYFTLGWDPTSQHLFSGGRDVPVTVWGTDGRVQKTIESPGMYVCCLDVELANQLLLMCGIYDPPAGAYKSRIAVYDGRPNQGFAPRGDIMRQEVDMTAVVRALPGTPNLITGESVRLPSGAFQEQISLYDLNRVMAPGVAGPGIEPVMTFQEHKNLVTCLAPLGLHSPGTFVSGSRDFTVKIWDIRSGNTAVATFGVQPSDIASTTHSEMVTCVDVSADGTMLLSGSLDQSLAAWDMRHPTARPLATAGPTSVCNQHGTQSQWSNHGILKAVLEGSPLDKLAAVATVQGLYTVDFSGAAPIITAAAALTKDGTAPKQYNDIRWASGSGRLYAAAGDAVSIDVLEVQQM